MAKKTAAAAMSSKPKTKSRKEGASQVESDGGRKSDADKQRALTERIERARVDIGLPASAAEIRRVIAATPEVDGPPMPIPKILAEARQAAFTAENDLEQPLLGKQGPIPRRALAWVAWSRASWSRPSG